jgi:hypothetical protein
MIISLVKNSRSTNKSNNAHINQECQILEHAVLRLGAAYISGRPVDGRYLYLRFGFHGGDVVVAVGAWWWW